MLHPVLQLDQFALQPEQLAEIGAAGIRVLGAALAVFGEIAVFHLQFEFLVVAVDQILRHALYEGLLGFGKRREGHGGSAAEIRHLGHPA